MSVVENPQRRRAVQTALVAGGLAATGTLLSVRALAADKAAVSMQLGWVPGGNQVGEVVAKRLGYYEQEGIDFSILPGGPNVAISEQAKSPSPQRLDFIRPWRPGLAAESGAGPTRSFFHRDDDGYLRASLSAWR